MAFKWGTKNENYRERKKPRHNSWSFHQMLSLEFLLFFSPWRIFPLSLVLGQSLFTWISNRQCAVVTSNSKNREYFTIDSNENAYKSVKWPTMCRSMSSVWAWQIIDLWSATNLEKNDEYAWANRSERTEWMEGRRVRVEAKNLITNGCVEQLKPKNYSHKQIIS